MIKAALEYITGLRAPQIEEIGGQIYSDKPLTRISYNPKADSIRVSTLTSLIDYLHSGTDALPKKMLVRVISPTSVELISALDDDRKRECLVDVIADLPDIVYDRYIDNESFLIALQSKFLPNADRDLLLKFAGTVEHGSVAQYSDDGVTQKATVKTGIASKGEAIVPNPVTLAPYRTFLEVEQPESAFIFRMQQGYEGAVDCAIFEADGGAWKNKAMQNVHAYLAEKLADIPGLTVIS